MKTNQQSKRIDASSMMLTAVQQFAEFQNVQDEDQRKEMFGRTTTALDDLINTYPDTNLGREAVYLKGQANYIMGNFEAAQTAYERYIEAAPDPESQARGEIALAYAHENQAFFLTETSAQNDRLVTAETHYRTAMEFTDKGSHLYYYAMLGIARVKELIRQDAEAIKIYEQVLEERPAQIAEPEAVEDEGRSSDPIVEMVREMVDAQESQLSFATTAKLRLDRLKSGQPATE
jgi:tetratricopeptide (TPR) repeat protein